MSPVFVRPVYSCRLRSLRGYVFGVYVDGECVLHCKEYPTEIMRGLS